MITSGSTLWGEPVELVTAYVDHAEVPVNFARYHVEVVV
jgi:hypothetical protein